MSSKRQRTEMMTTFASPLFKPFEVREVPGRAFEAPYAAPSGTVSGPAAGEGAADAWAPVDDVRGPFLQVDRTYLVRVVPDGFEVIDQHALHERTTFELLRREVRAGNVETQRMLVPEVVECSRAEVELISSHLEELRRAGSP